VRARVPAVLEADCARGMMLLEDVGEETFYQRAAREPWNVSSWFQQSMSIAAAIATLPIDPVRRLNPPLDAEMLRNELQRTWDVFARERTPAHLATPLQDVFDTLCADIGRDPLRPCHRDFMVRNLVPYSTPVEIVVLDHQDLRLGPRFYDIASLLNDSLFPSPALEGALLDDRLETRGDERLYHQTAAQRTLKAVGTYAAAAAEGRGQHLPLLEPTLRRAFQHLRRIPEARAMVAELESAWTVPTERSPGRTGRIDDGP
jgi:aminoglycoside/choline kinase family phosphotransferase